MMNVILTAALLTISKATECQNYIRSEFYVYPIGQCYRETDVEEIGIFNIFLV